MKHSQEKIIEALTVIKETCKENKDCNTCPFSNRGKCLISSVADRIAKKACDIVFSQEIEE